MTPVEVAHRALALLDLTSLNDGDTDATVADLCTKARTRHGDVAAVCVWPKFVARAHRALLGSAVKVAAVANFPDGAADPDGAARDATAIVEAGGDEVDVVFPWRALKSGDGKPGAAVVAAARKACGDRARLKVIIESGELSDPALIGEASRIALAEGADFLKTSTGKTRTSATEEAALVMLETIRSQGSRAGFKASGGIRDTATAGRYLTLADDVMGPDWAGRDTFRFGASGLLDDLLAVIEGGAGVPTRGGGY